MIPKRLATTECRKKGRERERGSEGEERKGKDREGGSKGERKGERERKGEGKGAREKARKGERERALLASVVHVARALYMNVTQDVAVWLSCILCTTPPDYTEYHARLRSIILNTMHKSALLY